jgi:hypothetical protein
MNRTEKQFVPWTSTIGGKSWVLKEKSVFLVEKMKALGE